jgi:enediyne biosynthesis protein E4
VTACDFNEDGHLDVYVSNYRLQPNLLWLGDGTGRFRNVAAEYSAEATSAGFAGGHSIGACWGDFDNEGHFDLFAGNFAHVDHRGNQPKSRFLRNLGPSKNYHFQDMGACGVYYQESYATPAAADYDDDGRLDLFFTTVYGTASFGKKNYPVLYRQEGPFVFSDATASAGLAELPPTSQAAWADFNNDGHLELVAGGKLFVHQGTVNHWLKVRLEGDGRIVDRSAIGTRVRVPLGDQTLTRQVEAGTGEGNQNDLTLHFGLGSHATPVSLQIFWPNASRQVVSDVSPDRTISIRFGKWP